MNMPIDLIDCFMPKKKISVNLSARHDILCKHTSKREGRLL